MSSFILGMNIIFMFLCGLVPRLGTRLVSVRDRSAPTPVKGLTLNLSVFSVLCKLYVVFILGVNGMHKCALALAWKELSSQKHTC